VTGAAERPPHFVSAVAFVFVFLVVIPEGDLLLSLFLLLPLLFMQKNIVISTEAGHSLIVTSAAERPAAFLFFPPALYQPIITIRLVPSPNPSKTCQAPKSRKPAPILHIRVAYELCPNSYT
jgi:hypothetical protein